MRYYIAIEKNDLEQHILKWLWQINEWNQVTKLIIKSIDLANRGWFMFTNYYANKNIFVPALENLCANLRCFEVCSCKVNLV